MKMQTRDLIKAIAADAGRARPTFTAVWGGAWLLSIGLAASAFFMMLGPRHDISQAVHSPRFLFKFVVTIVLALSAFGLLQALSRPAGRRRLPPQALLAAPFLLGAAIVAELMTLPAAEWLSKMVGTNNVLCLTFIPLIGAAPLAVFLAALRYGASTDPGPAGATAGLLAGGLAASFYAAHCPDDSPLFVAVWYTISILGLAMAGGLLAPRVARW